MNFLLTISALSREMVMRVDKMISLENLYVDIGAYKVNSHRNKDATCYLQGRNKVYGIRDQ